MNDIFEPSLLSGYLDNELTAAEVAVVEQALANDAQLQHELEEMRKLRAAIAALPIPPAQADMVAEVRRRIEQQQALRSGDSSETTNATLKLLVSFALAASVLVAVGWAILQQRHDAVPVAIDRIGEQPIVVPPQDPRRLIEERSATRQQDVYHSTPAAETLRQDGLAGGRGSGRGGADFVPEEPGTPRPQASEMNRDAGGQPAAKSAHEFAPAVPEIASTDEAQALTTPAPTPLSTPPSPAPTPPAPAPAAEPSQRLNMRRSSPAAGATASSESDAAMRVAPSSRSASSLALPPADIAVEGELQLRYLDGPTVGFRQPAASQLKRANSTKAGDRLEAGESLQASDGAEPARLPVLVSSLRKNQLSAAHAWLRQRADPAADVEFDADRQLILIAGPPLAVADLREHWSRYVQQNQGRLEVVSTSLTPAIAAEIPESAAAAGSPLLIQLQLSDSE